MEYHSILSIEQLKPHLTDPNWVIVDCRYDLADPQFGSRAYTSGHIPGAVFADINTQLSGQVIPGKTGRHPLPEIEKISGIFSNWGIEQDVQVVAYDDGGGKFAARLWWLLHWLGHSKVAVLDGGINHWQAAGYPMEIKPYKKNPRKFVPHPNPEMILDLSRLETIPNNLLIIDSRAPERYAGKMEPIDPIAGRIPGAKNRFFQNNLQSDGTFLSLKLLREQFEALANHTTIENTVFYCGSGITGSHNVLAMYTAGLGMAKLYPGSWSEWITDPNRPIERDD
ncbi:sulfurtransferase [bacterium]|nr:sulfurtransferase [bacterium]